MIDEYAQAQYEIAHENASMAKPAIGISRPQTARRQLEQKKAVLHGELAKVEAALAALDAHPDLEAFTETLKAALR